MKIFPTTRLIREMTRDCTHLVIFNTGMHFFDRLNFSFSFAPI